MNFIFREVIQWDRDRRDKLLKYWVESPDFINTLDDSPEMRRAGVTAEGPFARRFKGIDYNRRHLDFLYKGVSIDVKTIRSNTKRPPLDWHCQVGDAALEKRFPEVYFFCYINHDLTSVIMAGWILAEKFNLIATPLKKDQERGHQDHFKGQRFDCHEVHVYDLEEPMTLDDWED